MSELFFTLAQYNFWDNKKISLGYIRQKYLKNIMKFTNNKLIKVLVGQRRSGKSFLLRQIIHYLISEKNVHPKNIFYFSKEFIGFKDIKDVSDLDALFLLYKKKLNISGKVYIFLDEIQNISDWEKFVNSYSQDFTDEYEIFITGSNSKLLSGELATLLSGRFVEFKIFPFSYSEFIDIHNWEKSKTTYIHFLQSGGLPELINFKNQEIIQHYVESLKNTIILRDIISRYKIKDVNLLESLLVFMSSNIGNLTSISNIIKYFKNINKKTNYETLSSYVSYLLESFIFHQAERYDIRGKQTLSGIKKYYLNDLSFKNYLLGYTASDIGYNLENMVYLQLLHTGYKVYVGNLDKFEIDFIAQKKDKILYLQVAYLLSEQNVVEREFGNLKKIKDNYPKYVVTLDDIQFFDIEGVRHVRAWELCDYI